MSTLDQAIAQMSADGMPEFPPGHPRVDAGRIVRYGPNKRAWYRLFEVHTRTGRAVVVGAYGYWGVLDKQKIRIDWSGVGAEERADALARWREAEERERRKREEAANNAANRALAQWRGAHPLDHARERGIASAYCQRKQVEPEACRFLEDGTVYVPMIRYDAVDSGTLVGLQKLFPDGSKRFNRNMAKEGSCCRLGGPPDDGTALLVCEGWATGLTIRMATLRMLPVFVAFDAGNLEPVARVLRARYPSSAIVFCADDDWKTAKPNGTPWNPGVEKANAAARAIGRAWVVRPLFREANRADKWTDYNDVHVAYGLEEVTRQLNIARMIEAEPPVPSEPESGAPESTPASAGVGRLDGSGAPPGGAPPEEPPSVPPDEGRPRSWRDDLQRTSAGKLKPSVHNAFLYLANDPAWEGVLGYDTFSEIVVKLKPPPWPKGGEPGEWTELDDHRLLLWLSRRIGEPSTESLGKAVQLAAHRHEFNPLRDRLEGLKHDGKPRLRSWLTDYLGVNVDGLREQLSIAERSPKKNPELVARLSAEIERTLRYIKLVGMKWLIAAVARVMQPGCRVDYMLILEGEQGVKKSTTIEILGGDWYTDARLNFADKDSLLIVQGRWIIEMAELEGMNKAETSETKKFLTQHTDLFRPPYGRKLIKYPRRCVFAGTVNLDAYLKDDSGNRRFWPVRVTNIDTERLARDVDQLWAEAVALYRAGTPWWVLPDEREIFAEQQEQRFAVDAWEDLVIEFVDGRGEYSMEGELRRTSVTEILTKALKLDKARWDLQSQRRVVGVLRRHGWIRRRESTGSRQWFYERPSAKPNPEAAVTQPHEERYDQPF